MENISQQAQIKVGMILLFNFHTINENFLNTLNPKLILHFIETNGEYFAATPNENMGRIVLRLTQYCLLQLKKEASKQEEQEQQYQPNKEIFELLRSNMEVLSSQLWTDDRDIYEDHISLNDLDLVAKCVRCIVDECITMENNFQKQLKQGIVSGNLPFDHETDDGMKWIEIQVYIKQVCIINVNIANMRFVFSFRFVDELFKWLMNSALLTIPTLIADTMAENAGTGGDRGESGDKRLGDTGIVADLGTLSEDDEVDDEKKLNVITDAVETKDDSIIKNHIATIKCEYF